MKSQAKKKPNNLTPIKKDKIKKIKVSISPISSTHSNQNSFYENNHNNDNKKKSTNSPSKSEESKDDLIEPISSNSKDFNPSSELSYGCNQKRNKYLMKNCIIKDSKKEKQTTSIFSLMFSHFENNNVQDINEIEFLPCREKEQQNIYNYIKEGLSTTGEYSSLYIAGMPGTGKTASLLTVIKKLQNEYFTQAKNLKSNPHLIPFNYLYLNGMKITNPNSVFKIIYNHIFSEQRNKNVKQYIHLLDNFFRNRDDFNNKTILKDINNSHLLLVVDEVDCLVNHKQNLLYNLFNWTNYKKAKLIVISVSNTLDLPNRLQKKIESRMGRNKLMFSPYVKADLYKIISKQIQDVNLFSEDSLKFSCTKVATINGDLRRMLLICKQAKEIFLREKETNKNKKQIEKKHMIQACKELFDSKVISVIKSLQYIEKMLIATILYLMKIDNSVKIKVSDLFSKIKIFPKSQYELNWEEFCSIIFNLISLKIISFTELFQNNFMDNNICIKFYPDEFMNAVENEIAFSDVIQQLEEFEENKSKFK